VDGMATNGLRWGAQTEIRENFVGHGYTNNGVGTLAATNAQNSSSVTGTSGLTSGQTLYVRRAFVWTALDNVGLLRLGQGDGVSGIFDNGVTTFQNTGQGLWNGDAPILPAGNSQPFFPWYSQQGAEYGSNKIVYLSPQFFGIDAGFDYAPNNGNQEAGCGNASQGCPQLSSSNQVTTGGTPTDNFRFTNQTQLGVRYQGVFGPVAAYGFGDWIHSGVVDYTGPVPTGNPVGSKYTGQANGVNAGFVGAAFTIAGFQFGGAWQGGRYNGVMDTVPKGGSNANAWLVGFAYTNGPFTFGGAFYEFDTQGAVALTGISQEHNAAAGLGFNYQVTPGLQAYVEGLYSQVHQGDFNFVTGSAGSTAHNDAHDIALIVGLLVGW